MLNKKYQNLSGTFLFSFILVFVLGIIIGMVRCSPEQTEQEDEFEKIDAKIAQARSPEDCFKIAMDFYLQEKISQNIEHITTSSEMFKDHYFSSNPSLTEKRYIIRLDQMVAEGAILDKVYVLLLGCHIELDRKGFSDLNDFSPQAKKLSEFLKNQSDPS